MVLLKLKPLLAKMLISPREADGVRCEDSFKYLEKEIQEGKWEQIPPIWVTPNYLLNGLVNFTLKPFIMYNGHHRLEKAIEHSLPVNVYVRFTFGNPPLPKSERLLEAYLSEV